MYRKERGRNLRVSDMHPHKNIYRQTNLGDKTVVYQDKLIYCRSCKKNILRTKLQENMMICPNCGYLFRMSSKQRIDQVLDAKSFKEFNPQMSTLDPLNFPKYKGKLLKDQHKTNQKDAILTGIGEVCGKKVVIAVMDSRFRMASMGIVVGEKIRAAAEVSEKKRYPLILFVASGGARMQEGTLSLMQMVKTNQAMQTLKNAGILTVVVITDPTTGGVTASFASQGDITIGEKGAMIGFAGKRVINQTIAQALPDDCQTSEFAYKTGHIDAVIDRSNLKNYLSRLLVVLTLSKQSKTMTLNKYDLSNGINDITKQIRLVRENDRPQALDFFRVIGKDFIELHGDREKMDDESICAGFSNVRGIPVMFVGQNRGHSSKELIQRNFGMTKPQGYRKAIRAVELASSLGLPVITMIDIKGADPTADSETNNQSGAISDCISTFLRCKSPILSIVIGEGGSGGAVALAAGNKLMMLKNSIFSVISPEGAATILWKNSAMINEAAVALKLTAKHLKDFGIVDTIVPELTKNVLKNINEQSEILTNYITDFLEEYSHKSVKEIMDEKKKKFNSIGLKWVD